MSNNLQQVRDDLGIPIEAPALALGVSGSTIRYWESGGGLDYMRSRSAVLRYVAWLAAQATAAGRADIDTSIAALCPDLAQSTEVAHVA